MWSCVDVMDGEDRDIRRRRRRRRSLWNPTKRERAERA